MMTMNNLEDTTQKLIQMFQNGDIDFGSIFGGDANIKKTSNFEDLGNGYELRPIEFKNKKGEAIKNQSRYSHLYHNGLKVSDLIFRKGGTGGKFKDGYCELLLYREIKKGNEFGLDSGTFVIINHLGEISLEGGKYPSDHPHHLGGNLAKLGNNLYSLSTGNPICPVSASKIVGYKYVIIEHKYDWYNKEIDLPVGIYQIDKESCEVLKIDEVK